MHGEGTRARLAFDLMLYTGQRRSDVIRMGHQHVRNGVLSIRQSKTGTMVEIPLHPRLKAILDGLPRDNLTFLVTDQGKSFSPAGFGNWIGDCVKKAGLRQGMAKGEKGLASHGLRKAICRRLADAGCDALQIMAITGHRDIKQIMIYIEARDRGRAAEAAIKAIGEHPGGTKRDQAV